MRYIKLFFDCDVASLRAARGPRGSARTTYGMKRSPRHESKVRPSRVLFQGRIDRQRNSPLIRPTGRQNQPRCTRRISPGNYSELFRLSSLLPPRLCNICEGRRAHNAATSTKDGITNYLTGFAFMGGPHAPQAAPSETREASVNEAAAYRWGILSYVSLDAIPGFRVK